MSSSDSNSHGQVAERNLNDRQALILAILLNSQDNCIFRVQEFMRQGNSFIQAVRLTGKQNEVLGTASALLGRAVDANSSVKNFDLERVNISAELLARASRQEIFVEGATFKDQAVFSKVTFGVPVRLIACTFESSAHFDYSKFDAGLDCSRSRFRSSSFRGVEYAVVARFEGCTFNGAANFTEGTFTSKSPDTASAQFKGISLSWDLSSADFLETTHFAKITAKGLFDARGARFRGTLNVADSSFCSEANFTNCQFEKSVTFDAAKFFGSPINFFKATFAEGLLFRQCDVRGVARFESSKFEGSTSFANTVFCEPPKFFSAQIHQGFALHGARFCRGKGPWHEAASAWRVLKQKCGELKAHSEELEFFAKEMRATAEGSVRLAVPVHLYDWTSNFGRSLLRPLLLLAVAVAIPVGLSVITCWPCISDVLTLSLANLLPGVGDKFGSAIAATKCLTFKAGGNGLVDTMRALQTVVALFAYFLIGLALRNSFRLGS